MKKITAQQFVDTFGVTLKTYRFEGRNYITANNGLREYPVTQYIRLTSIKRTLEPSKPYTKIDAQEFADLFRVYVAKDEDGTVWGFKSKPCKVDDKPIWWAGNKEGETLQLSWLVREHSLSNDKYIEPNKLEIRKVIAQQFVDTFGGYVVLVKSHGFSYISAYSDDMLKSSNSVTTLVSMEGLKAGVLVGSGECQKTISAQEVADMFGIYVAKDKDTCMVWGYLSEPYIVSGTWCVKDKKALVSIYWLVDSESVSFDKYIAPRKGIKA